MATIPKLKEGDLIQVFWRDAGNPLPDQTWVGMESINFDECDFDLSAPETSGYFVKKTQFFLYMCQTFTPEQIINLFAIPLGCIDKVVKK